MSDLSLDELLARIHDGPPAPMPPREERHRRRRPQKPLPREVEYELADEHGRYLAASDKLTDVMIAARLRGASMAEIGRACGMTKQSVYARLKKRKEGAE